MIIEAARLAIANLFALETRTVFWKVLSITLLVLVGLWFALDGAFISFALPWLEAFFPNIPHWATWLAYGFAVMASFGLAIGLSLLLSPVTALIAGLFLDDIAEVVEKRDYPTDAPGKAMAFGPAIVSSLKFLFVIVLGNIVALILLLVPVVNLAAFFIVNGYLLGREFFEFAAMRFRSPDEARQFRAKHGSMVFLGGLLIAAFLAIPIVNLLTPLFAAAMMVHLHKMLSRKDPSFADNFRR
ncbi:sulfate transporter family protein [Rhizobium sp. 2YAF20]|uniref:sulfate transporter family protein n=1 Tax=Rhizobium sp. 2YAF20 TaxID=3233027 RepID=UPI003F9B04D5